VSARAAASGRHVDVRVRIARFVGLLVAYDGRLVADS
jgi:hypothetical protein